MPVSATSARPAQRLMSADDALARILAGVPPLPEVDVPILEALGLVLAEEITADRDVPPFRNSAMDGYAVRGDDVGSAPVRLRVVGEIAAGAFPERAIGKGEAMRIMTGAPMPDGADTVVRVEDTDNASDVVTVGAVTPKGISVRQAGEDLRKGESILARGMVLRAADIGLLASVGRGRVTVRKRPRVAVFSTGDEIVDVDAPLPQGKIRDSNRYTLASAIRATGAEPWVRGIVRDAPDALRAALREAVSADAIVTSGGVSVGDHDHMKPVLSELGTIDFWAIAIRPGRPLAFGELRDGERRVPIFGLPGNTVSALLTFEIFVRPALLRMQGREKVSRPRARARLLEPIDKVGALRFFARGIHDPDAGTVRLTGPQGSGILRSLSLANCLIDLPVGPTRIEAGEQVDVILTESPEPR
ncbi:MAG TPA: gephyrin-like molybdotransferase Glp [Candidatus Limnocylindria bacterium]|jgi:molybdopterin molybdotransferase|nr:gephyrin-like molybdotransferase Glp [Candidatus Limnocylindria bacterium]